MNLLRDPWIPVKTANTFKQITYKELLCSEQPEIQIALPRDDLEFACIQMLAALTQIIFMPEDKNELRERINNPLLESEYNEAVKEAEHFLDLNHHKWPFMQVIDPGTNVETPVQKLFPGLPAGNNHSFFNKNNEFEKVCPSCAAVGLFNLCTNTPNLSGKHKGGLRGNAPVSTMVYDGVLRRMVLSNVLAKEIVDRIFFGDRIEKLTWEEPIEEGKKNSSMNIGLARGLFWTPIQLRLQIENRPIICDCCGIESNVCIEKFHLGSDYKFEVTGLWPHPFSPRQINLPKNNNKKPDETTISFRTAAPAWTQFSEILFHTNRTEKKEGFIPSAVVTQYRDLYKDKNMSLIIGGYRNKKAAILQRRHELYTFPAGWNDGLRSQIIEIIEIGLEVKKLLTDKVIYPLIKGNKDKNEKGIGAAINVQATDLYFQISEPVIHQMLQERSLREFVSSKNEFLNDLSQICFDIFDHVTQPYNHKPELIGTISIARNKLKVLLNKLLKENTVAGGSK